MADTKEEFNKDVKFANWNGWYNDLTTEIAEIRKYGHLVMFDPKQVNHYYSRIVNLVSTIEWAIDDTKTINSNLDKIEDNIFSERYLKDLEVKTVTEYQRKVVKRLRRILAKVCNDLSDGGLLPKVEKTKVDRRPSAVRNLK